MVANNEVNLKLLYEKSLPKGRRSLIGKSLARIDWQGIIPAPLLPNA
jgi:hypothetical protein